MISSTHYWIRNQFHAEQSYHRCGATSTTLDHVRLIWRRDGVAPCLSNAPDNGSISGFSLGRVTKVRSGLNGVLGPTATATAAVSGVRSNATGSSVELYWTGVSGGGNYWCGTSVEMRFCVRTGSGNF